MLLTYTEYISSIYTLTTRSETLLRINEAPVETPGLTPKQMIQ